MKILFQSNINALRKVRDMLSFSCKMNGGTIILGETNKAKLATAKQKLEEAIAKLEEIQ